MKDSIGTTQNREAVLSEANSMRWEINLDLHETVVDDIYQEAARISTRVLEKPKEKRAFDLERSIDRIVTSKIWGFPLMFLLFTLVFWITISGANVPSAFLSSILIDRIYPWLGEQALGLGFPWWLKGVLVDGIYLATAWVVSVMLPPMAIFFPLFTLLEDFGYLPRMAFNLDSVFRKAGAHGKQALSMMMGFGCNAAGVVATRIIDSPRERLIAIITNNFSLCNGRWPTQILIATVFIGPLVPAYLGGLISAGAVVAVALLGILFTFIVSWGLSKTVLRGEVSTFSLELPPYRPPQILQTIYTSMIDRTLIVLYRAVVFAVPAGAAIWLIANLQVSGASLDEHMINFLDPAALLFGMNGVILVAYIVAIPANEIVIPTILMLTVLTSSVAGIDYGTGVLFELESASGTLEILQAGGWTLLTGINLMLFSLLHNPCSTTIFTIYKETGSWKWTALATLLPVGLGFMVTFFITQLWRLAIGLF